VEDPAKPLARRMPRRAIWSGSVISGGNGRSGLALAMPWWGRWLVEGLELAQGPWEALPVPDQRAVEESRRQECTHRSEIAFIRGIRTTARMERTAACQGRPGSRGLPWCPSCR